jgi:hypothetical protein
MKGIKIHANSRVEIDSELPHDVLDASIMVPIMKGNVVNIHGQSLIGKEVEKEAVNRKLESFRKLILSQELRKLLIKEKLSASSLSQVTLE